MKGLALCACLLASTSIARGAWPQNDLRSDVELAAQDGFSAEELIALAERGFASAERASSRSSFWSAMGLVAELCQSGPPAEARKVRGRALDALATRDSDTMRWSALVTKAFIPPFGSLARSAWAQELAAYDTQLDVLLNGTTSARVRAELAYAKLRVRVYINRRWDWLGDGGRTDALAMVTALGSGTDNQPVPGSDDTDNRTVAARARSHRYELEQLHFGAPAPSTTGIDLKGRPFDLSEYEGQVVVLDFWTTFCQPCLALVPGVRKLMGELARDPVVYLGVNGDTRRESGLATAERHGMNWRNLWDGPAGPSGPAAVAWNVPALGWPSVFVLDTRGRIRFKLRGKDQVDAELESAIRMLLAE